MESELVKNENNEIVINHYGDEMDEESCFCPECEKINYYYLDECGVPQLSSCRNCGCDLDNY